jgi:hypothetical protein
MSQDELQKRHDRLVDFTRKMRGHQKEFFKYRAKVDLDAARRYERMVDSLIDEEVKQQKSKQTEMF